MTLQQGIRSNWRPQAWGWRPQAWGWRPQAWGWRPQAWGWRPQAWGWRPQAWGWRPQAWGWHPQAWVGVRKLEPTLGHPRPFVILVVLTAWRSFPLKKG